MGNRRKLVDLVTEQSRFELIRFLLGPLLRGMEEEERFSLSAPSK
jgi:hypothetical protein